MVHASDKPFPEPTHSGQPPANAMHHKGTTHIHHEGRVVKGCLLISVLRQVRQVRPSLPEGWDSLIDLSV